MALKRETHLDDTPAEQDQTHRTNQTEDEITEVIHHSQGIAAGGRNGDRQSAGGADGQHRQGITAEAPLNPAGDGDTCGGAVFFFPEQIHDFRSPFLGMILPAPPR